MPASAVRAAAGPRLLRTAVFTAVCVVLAGVGHALASGVPVPWWPQALGFIGLFVLAAPLAGRARSLPCIATALTVGQLGLHTLFGLGQQTSMAMGSMGPISPMSRMNPMATGHPAADPPTLVALAGKLVCGAGAAPLSLAQAHSIVTASGLDPTAAGARTAPHTMTAATASTVMLPTLPMMIGHLLAALMTGWLLRRGEVALSRLNRLSHGVAEGALVRNLRAALALVRALRTGLPRTPAQRPRPGYAPLPAPRWTAGEALQHTVIRRGPPPVYVHAA